MLFISSASIWVLAVLVIAESVVFASRQQPSSLRLPPISVFGSFFIWSGSLLVAYGMHLFGMRLEWAPVVVAAVAFFRAVEIARNHRRSVVTRQVS